LRTENRGLMKRLQLTIITPPVRVPHQDVCIKWLGPESKRLVSKWHASLGAVHASDPPIAPVNLPRFISELQKMGMKVCVVTSDSREASIQALSRWGILSMIGTENVLTCTDVSLSQAKPNPYPVLHFCRKHNCAPSETVVVGDTLGDTGLGRNANVGLTVGVLSGSGREEELLEGGADVVLPDVSHFMGWYKGWEAGRMVKGSAN
jgi:phosphoglycolate phosphatase-like HAD superfamily hydrolase